MPQEFPKMLYHKTEPPKTVKNLDEQNALGADWHTSPSDIPPDSGAEPDPVERTITLPEMVSPELVPQDAAAAPAPTDDERSDEDKAGDESGGKKKKSR